MTEIFDQSAIGLYLLGFITFFIKLIDDFLNRKKEMKSFGYYFSDFLYTVLSIAIGISFCYFVGTGKSICWIVSIGMGLIGSTLIRKFISKKDKFCDNILDSVEQKTTSTIHNDSNDATKNNINSEDGEL